MPEAINSNLVDLVDDSGEFYTVEKSELPQAHMMGYRPPTKEELHYRETKEKYGTGIDNQLKALGTAAVGSVPVVGGLVNKAFGVTPEAKAAREEFYPGTSFVGTTSGILAQAAGLGALTGAGAITADAAALAAEKKGAEFAAKSVISNVAEHALGSGVQGALYSSGQVANEAILGDPDLTAQRAWHEIGTGFLLGAGTGALLGGAQSALAKRGLKDIAELAGDDASAVKEAAAREAISESDAAVTSKMAQDRAAAPIEDIIKEMEGMDIPQAENLKLDEAMAARDRLPDLKYPPLRAQLETLNSAEAKETYQKMVMQHSESGEALRNLHAVQKQTWADDLKDTIKSISPTGEVSADKIEAGDKAISLMENSTKAVKEELKPHWQAFSKEVLDPLSSPGSIIGKLEEAVPGSSDLMEFNAAEGKIKMLPYSHSTEITEEAYQAMKKVVDVVNEDKPTLNGIRNIRNKMEDMINWQDKKVASGQISKIRQRLMDFMVENIDSKNVGMDVKELFKKNAINESNIDTLEEILGGRFGKNTGYKGRIVREDALEKIFRNSNAVDAAKNILGADFDQITADYLNTNVEKLIDSSKDVFPAKQIEKFLSRKEYGLGLALDSQPQALQKMQDITTLTKMFPNMPSLSVPNSEARLSMIEKINKILHPMDSLHDLISKGVDKINEIGENTNRARLFNEIQKGKSFEEAKAAAENKIMRFVTLKNIEKASLDSARKVKAAVNKTFSVDPSPSIIVAAEKPISAEKKLEKFNKVSKQLELLAGDPQALQTKISDGTSDLYRYAPQVASGVQMSAARAVSFLSSKLPQKPPELIFSPSWEPSQAQINTFNKYLASVNDPLTPMKELANGTLSHQSIEAVMAVHPNLYDSMRTELIQKAATKKNIPYNKKLMISMFVGQPLSNSMTPQSILGNQTSLNSPSQKDQENVAGVKPTAKGLSNLSQADRILTPMQKALQRKE